MRLSQCSHAFCCLPDNLINNALQIASLLECRKLPVGARTMFHDVIRVLDFLPRAELVHDVAEEPLDELPDEHGSGQLLFLTEIYELALQTPTDSPPFVLLDQLGAVNPECEVVAPELPHFRN